MMSPLAYKPLVGEIVLNVRTGIRNKEELQKCGCPSCLEALWMLGAKA